MKTISVYKNKIIVTSALVDDNMFDDINKYRWFSHRGYAKRHIYVNGKTKNICMHNQIMGKKEGFETDHIDGNRLNNQLSNLRKCNHTENMQNAFKRPNCKSIYKGVKPLNNGKYEARIFINKKFKYLGLFETEEKAAKEYDKFAIELFKEFARLNFPVENNIRPVTALPVMV